MDIVKLSGVIKSYEWGDSYFISSLLNRKKSNYPQGELWMGTHPMGESTLLMDEIPLSQYIASSPIEVLGASHIKRFNEELPFLLKVLAIKNPLSLQVHPNSEQAKRGYEEETEQRGLTEAALLNYKDNRQKDEVLFAITPTTAMVGFRTLSEILENFSLILHEKGDIFVNCTSVEEFFETLFILDGNTKESMLLDLKEYVNTPSEIEPSLFLSSKEIAKRALLAISLLLRKSDGSISDGVFTYSFKSRSILSFVFPSKINSVSKNSSTEVQFTKMSPFSCKIKEKFSKISLNVLKPTMAVVGVIAKRTSSFCLLSL